MEQKKSGCEGVESEGRVRRKRGIGRQPAACRTYTRARMAEALPEIVERFVEEAKKGSIAHAKLLTTLSGLDKTELAVAKKRGKSVVALLMERLGEAPKKEAAKRESK